MERCKGLSSGLNEADGQNLNMNSTPMNQSSADGLDLNSPNPKPKGTNSNQLQPEEPVLREQGGCVVSLPAGLELEDGSDSYQFELGTYNPETDNSTDCFDTLS